jgi:hypothetical protein
VLWVAVLSRAALDVRHGTEAESLAVLAWMARERDEFEQVITLAGLESGHAERFERAMCAAFERRFRRPPDHRSQGRAFDNSEAVA